mmetsp:Transcript_18685/g.58769  ORF Transcript_18685/g.58769 Transcript_18685/m.58769 type:complete len:146 (-) Transcript_18685:86-523(-)
MRHHPLFFTEPPLSPADPSALERRHQPPSLSLDSKTRTTLARRSDSEEEEEEETGRATDSQFRATACSAAQRPLLSLCLFVCLSVSLSPPRVPPRPRHRPHPLSRGLHPVGNHLPRESPLQMAADGLPKTGTRPTTPVIALVITP